MTDLDWHDCPSGKGVGGTVTMTLPEGWRWMPRFMVDLHTVHKCGECGKILKYAGVYRAKRADGEYEWRTA